MNDTTLIKVDENHFRDIRDSNLICAEHKCGVEWYDSGQKELRYWRVCSKHHHAFNDSFQYSAIYPILKVA